MGFQQKKLCQDYCIHIHMYIYVYSNPYIYIYVCVCVCVLMERVVYMLQHNLTFHYNIPNHCFSLPNPTSRTRPWGLLSL
jgi:hypothetical protein